LLKCGIYLKRCLRIPLMKMVCFNIKSHIGVA
jgi:hypothetical protein